jgi:hypothetical protein
MKQPNPKMHFVLSMVKSGFRIAAGYYLASGNYVLAGTNFIIAEMIGILEKMV